MKTPIIISIAILFAIPARPGEPQPPEGFRKVTTPITLRVKAHRPNPAKNDPDDGRLCMQMCTTQDQGQRTYIAVSYNPADISDQSCPAPGRGWIERTGCVYFPYTDKPGWAHTIFESVGLPVR